eukprot:6208939-Pleurochrysis_carterae.AAC.1
MREYELFAVIVRTSASACAQTRVRASAPACTRATHAYTSVGPTPSPPAMPARLGRMPGLSLTVSTMICSLLSSCAPCVGV